MGNTYDDKNDREDTSYDQGLEEGSLSLSGKGWDILVGGEDNALALGGENPFGVSEEGAETDLLSLMEAGSTEGPSPSDVLYDRGRGGDQPEKFAPADEGFHGAGQPASAMGKAISPGVSVEVISSGKPPLTEDAPPPDSLMPTKSDFSGPAGSGSPSLPPLSEMTTPPMDLSASEPRPFTGKPQPFSSAEGSAPFSSPKPPSDIPTVRPAGPVPVDGAGSIDTPPPARALSTGYARPYDPFTDEDTTQPSVKKQEEPELIPDDELGRKLITDERIKSLWEEIDQTYSIVIDGVRGHYGMTDAAIEDLKKAREYLLAGLEHYDNAEELVKRVKTRLRLEHKVRHWSRTTGAWLGAYLVIWLLFLISMLFLTKRLEEMVVLLVPEWLTVILFPGIFGSLGGVVGALWVLIKHIARKRDFDPIHAPWYIINPFMGMAMGVVAYFLLFAASIPFGGSFSASPGEIGSPESVGIYGLYVLCFIVGFNQNILWALIDRVTKAIVPPQETRALLEEDTGKGSGN